MISSWSKRQTSMDSYWDGYDVSSDPHCNAKPVYVLKNWGVRAAANPYMAPEAHTTVLCGEVYHDPKRKDGTPITTTRIISSLDNIVETCNSYYELQEPCVTYQAWCEANDITIDPDNPIKIK